MLQLSNKPPDQRLVPGGRLDRLPVTRDKKAQKIMKSDPRRIGGINLTFHFPNRLELTEKQQIIFERAAKTCPVVYSINPDIELRIEFNWKADVKI